MEAARVIIARVFTGITNHFPVRASEWALAFMMVGWGFIVLQPDEMFAVVPAYSHMSMIASETAWGSATTCIGGNQDRGVDRKRDVRRDMVGPVVASPSGGSLLRCLLSMGFDIIGSICQSGAEYRACHLSVPVRA